jgi:hypothetical protein
MLALTVITPDEGGSFPAWAYDMATAIVAKNGVYDQRDADGNGVVDIVQNARIDLSGQRQLVGAGAVAPNVVLFDWTSVSDQAGIADSPLVTQALRNYIEQNIPTGDVHFIGFGRGAMVNMGVLRSLNANDASRILQLQVTTLDPYARGDDGALEANPGGNVDFADNYYQNINSQQVSGSALTGALNFRLNDQLAAWNGRVGTAGNHQEVHDWYHWTIVPELASSAVPRSDPSLSVPNTATRELLYGEYVADLNSDGFADDFHGGANIGFYFSLDGGGIGKTVLVKNGNLPFGVYTLDVKTGKLPLYLGHLNANPPDQIAYHSQGDLFYTDLNSQLARARVQFDANNNPVWTSTLVGAPLGPSFPHTIEFSRDGRLARGEADILMELSPDTGQILRSQSLSWGSATIAAIAFDPNYNLLVVRQPTSPSESPSLLYFDTTSLAFIDGFDINYRDITQLAMIDGLLYAFRENGEYATINVMTRKITERGPLDLPPGATLISMTSATNLVKNRWHNPTLPNDVNEDGRINSSDVLTVINTLLVDGARPLGSAGELRSYLYDVTNDLRVNSSDVLAVINQILLNSEASAMSSEELAVAQPTAVEPLAAENSPFDGELADALAFALAIRTADPKDATGSVNR